LVADCFAEGWRGKATQFNASQALDHPDPAISGIYRRQFLEANRNDSEQRRAPPWRGEEAYALISELISNLRNLGAEGRIIASGLYAGTGQRQLVPAELFEAEIMVPKDMLVSSSISAYLSMPVLLRLVLGFL
jgi:hypothetical protein